MALNKGLAIDEAKKRVVHSIACGVQTDVAMAQVGRTRKTYENWRAADPAFAGEVDAVRVALRRAKGLSKDKTLKDLSFAEWRKRFLNRETYPHQQMWIDVLEGREPQNIHQSIKYEPGRATRVLINTPPFHAKSTVITQEYITYRICMNPAIRVIIVSKTREQAKKFLYSIKKMLTGPAFLDLQAAYSPSSEGFKGKDSWTSTTIYVAGRGDADATDPAAKDPTVECLGIGGAIYGARADLIVLDDCVTLDNATGHGGQIDWLNQEVASRAKNGKILVVGTRVASVDLYSELRNGDNFVSGKSPWTYLGQPAVLEYAEKPEDWVTLWPRSTHPLDEENADEADEDGLYPAWDGPSLSAIRESVRPRTWSLVYMQNDVAEDATFHPVCVTGSVDRRRKPGALRAGAWGSPRNGQEGMHVIGSIDPAGTGEAFVLAYAVDRISRERWVLNAWGRSNTTPTWYADMVEMLHSDFNMDELVIESNAYASWIIHDERIVKYCRERGIRISPHYTSRNKQDPDFGVASMASLFGSLRRIHEGAGREVHNDDNIIHLPDPSMSEGVKMLIEQLISWQPGKKGKDLRQDGPMSLWFAELRARLIVSPQIVMTPQHFVDNPYLSRGDRARRAVYPTGAARLFVRHNSD